MKKWFLWIAIGVLLAGSGTNTYFYVQQNNRLNQVDARISGLLSNITSVQNGLTSLQGNVSTLGESVSSLSTNVGALNGKISALETTTSGLSGDVNTLKSNITTINGNITTINGNITSISGNVTSVNNSVTALQNSVSSMQSSVAALQAGAQAVANVVSKVEPAVVKIICSVSRGYAGGSGAIVRNNGYILTAYHVVEGATSISVTLKTGEVFSATLVNYNRGLDIAVLKLTTTRTDFPVIALGSSTAAQVGEEVIVIGYPQLFDLPGQATFTKGIISAIRNMFGYRFIQTDAAINHGNSGGPMVNMKGELLGVADWKFFSDDEGEPIESLGFCIPIDDAKYLIP